MSNERETLADIVAEIRAYGAHPPPRLMRLEIADRILAAWKRQEKTYLDQIRDAMNMWGHEKYIAEHAQKPTVGNAAALREALSDMCYAAMDIFRYFRGSQNKIIANLGVEVDKAKAALSAPARQCDVGTAEEIDTRWNAYCGKRIKRENCMSEKNCKGCAWRWAQTPYTEEGGAE